MEWGFKIKMISVCFLFPPATIPGNSSLRISDGLWDTNAASAFCGATLLRLSQACSIQYWSRYLIFVGGFLRLQSFATHKTDQLRHSRVNHVHHEQPRR